ncbi:MAG: hypothetical protein F7B61_04795 [Caldisphaeraceae archaeon]|nr:hypothetical protein [Caldisphaeraceae archaeon]
MERRSGVTTKEKKGYDMSSDELKKGLSLMIPKALIGVKAMNAYERLSKLNPLIAYKHQITKPTLSARCLCIQGKRLRL